MAPSKGFFIDSDPASLSQPATDKTSLQSTVTPFDPVDEYRAILELTDTDTKKRLPRKITAAEPDVYSDLMSKERRVLDTIDRVVNDAVVTSRNKDGGGGLIGMPVHEIIMRTIGSMRSMWDDLISARSIEDVVSALKDRSRHAFLGIAMISIAVIASLVLLMSSA
jgi:hypothetical protein